MEFISLEKAIEIVRTPSIDTWEIYSGYYVKEDTEMFISNTITKGNFTYNIFLNRFEGEEYAELYLKKSVISELVICPMLLEFAGWSEYEVDSTIEEIAERLWKVYPRKKVFEISDKGEVLVDKSKVKIGKLLKTIEPTLNQFALSTAADKINILKIDFDKNTKTTKRVTEFYNSKHLKIRSCMSHCGYSLKLLEDLGIEVIYLVDNKGNAIARSLLHEGKYIDRIYATNFSLVGAFREHLLKKYEDMPNQYESKPIYVDEDTFYPYMDNLRYLTKHQNGTVTLQNYAPEVYVMSSLSGDLHSL